MSENLSAGVSCCLDTRGRWLGDSLSLPARLLLGPGVDLIWISWMMLRVPGVDTLMGFARTKLVPDSSAYWLEFYIIREEINMQIPFQVKLMLYSLL